MSKLTIKVNSVDINSIDFVDVKVNMVKISWQNQIDNQIYSLEQGMQDFLKQYNNILKSLEQKVECRNLSKDKHQMIIKNQKISYDKFLRFRVLTCLHRFAKTKPRLKVLYQQLKKWNLF